MNSSHQAELSCPLCLEKKLEVFYRQTKSIPWQLYHLKETHDTSELCFFKCLHCSLVIKDPSVWLSNEFERIHYSTHENSTGDQRYLDFLRKLAEPLLDRLAEASHGLDFGSGPEPAMAHLFKEMGHQCDSYDVHFFPDRKLLNQTYDFITCSEVFEHLKQPNQEFELLLGTMMKPGSWLGVMTAGAPETPEAFSRWHYHLDPTHIVFYSPATFQWIANRWGFRYDGTTETVTLFQKELAK